MNELSQKGVKYVVKVNNQVQKIEDKSLLIRVIENNDFDIDGNPKPNFWLSGIEVSEKGQSGYEQNGEIRFIGDE